MNWKDMRARKVRAELSNRVQQSFSILELHLAGQHDQSSHGSWAEGAAVGDVPPEARDEVQAIFDARKKVEPSTTGALSRIAGQFGGRMLGLKYKFKKASGVVEKIERKARDKGISVEQAASSISDALRYTMELDPDNYVEGALSAVRALEDEGYEFLELENNWAKGDAYNGINGVFRDPETGLKVELQFHTADSWRIKDDVIHEDYEFVRERRGTSAQRLLAHERMRQASDSVEFPPGVDDFCEKAPKCKNVYRPSTETLFASAPRWRSYGS